MKKINLLLLLMPFITFSQGWFIQQTFNPAQTIYALEFYDANTGYCVSVLYNMSTYNIYKTTNGGQNWTAQNSGYTATRFMSICILNPDTVYMSGNFGLIIKTVNGGQNWVTLPASNSDQLWGIQFVNSYTGYVCGSAGRIMKTTNAGANWTNQTSGVQNAFSSIYFLNENTGYISGSAIVLKTTDGGMTWVNTNAPYISGFENFREITFTGANTGYYVSDLGRILKTTNGGLNWTLLITGTTEALFGIYFTDANTAYVSGNAGTIIRTTNAGGNWSPQVSGLNEILPDIWFTSALTGYICSWTGKILKTTNGGVTFITKISSEVPESYILEQNYPNPFNPITKIRFSIPAGETQRNVSLQVYDVLGKLAATLVNEGLSPGTYEVNWNASSYQSGVYFYQLVAGNPTNNSVIKAGDFKASKKMILVK
jgi:photosystem II stability/assembly factor-like uncharacterized protein